MKRIIPIGYIAMMVLLTCFVFLGGPESDQGWASLGQFYVLVLATRTAMIIGVALLVSVIVGLFRSDPKSSERRKYLQAIVCVGLGLSLGIAVLL